MARRTTALLAGAALGAAGLFDGIAHAAPEWIDRSLTLPRHDWAFDFGLGIAHVDPPAPVPVPGPGPDNTGVGMNLEMGVGLTRDIELGVRGGLRLDQEGKALQADQYGRLFDRQTFGTGADTFANPEVRVRGEVVRGEVAEVALEGRAYVPFEFGTRPGFMFGVPFAFHLGQVARLDLGVYLPFVFYDPVFYAVSIPFDAWFQVTRRVWLGPMTGVRFNRFTDNTSRTDVSLGFGLGVQITRALDFKTMFLFPRINDDRRTALFGVGAGIQVRIE
jgi:hypothetical protein